MEPQSNADTNTTTQSPARRLTPSIGARGAAIKGGSARPALVAARCSLACAIAFPLMLALAQLAHPELDPSWQPISEYALGEHGWIMTLAFLAWGLAGLALSIAVRRDVGTRAGKVGLGLLVIGAAGPLLAAVFPMDPLTTPTERMTTSGMIHGVGALIGDALPIAGLMLTFILTRSHPRWAAYRRALWCAASAAGLALAASCVAMAVLMPASGQLGPEVRVGWVMRLFVVACVAWIGVAARVAATSR